MRQDGTSGNDIMRTNSEVKDLRGHAGNDTLYVESQGGAAHGGAGNDTLFGGGDGRAQAHLYGGRGDDTIYMSASDRTAPFGSHAWGNEGRDTFIFTDVWNSESRSTGRIDDFDYSRDEIWVEDEKIDLKNPPDYVRIVELKGQPWILIDDRILYTLEGARQTLGPDYSPSEEVHFIDWPPEWEHGVPKSADITYDDFVEFFPADRMHVSGEGLNRVAGNNGADILNGSAGDDYIWGGDGADELSGGAGNDLMNGGEGYDVLRGGAGDDMMAGGIDQDKLYGGDGNDIAYGGSGRDEVHGDAGNDNLYGNSENDLVDGGAGDDLLYGGRGDDVLVGGAGSDRLFGGDGNDVLIAGSAGQGHATPPFPMEAGTDEISEPDAAWDHNTLIAGNGDDRLYAASEASNTLTGGDGRDHFIAAENSEIRITDFVLGTDKLDISGLVDPQTDLASLFAVEGRNDGTDILDLHMRLPDGGHFVFDGLGETNLRDFTGSIINNPTAPNPEDHIHDWHEAGPPDLGAPHRPHDDHPPHEDKDPKDPKDDPKDGDGEGGSCFIATASYGNAAHPDVAWLRAFRDEVLLPHPIGRAFIRFYWQVGPLMAKLVRHDGASGRMMRRALGGLVQFGRR